jgi:hypothetical protein
LCLEVTNSKMAGSILGRQPGLADGTPRGLLHRACWDLCKLEPVGSDYVFQWLQVINYYIFEQKNGHSGQRAAQSEGTDSIQRRLRTVNKGLPERGLGAFPPLLNFFDQLFILLT